MTENAKLFKLLKEENIPYEVLEDDTIVILGNGFVTVVVCNTLMDCYFGACMAQDAYKQLLLEFNQKAAKEQDARYHNLGYYAWKYGTDVVQINGCGAYWLVCDVLTNFASVN